MSSIVKLRQRSLHISKTIKSIPQLLTPEFMYSIRPRTLARLAKVFHNFLTIELVTPICSKVSSSELLQQQHLTSFTSLTLIWTSLMGMLFSTFTKERKKIWRKLLSPKSSLKFFVHRFLVSTPPMHFRI